MDLIVRTSVASAWALLLASADRTAAQRPDSIAATPEAAVHRVWNAYVASKGGRFAANAGTRSTLWLGSEQERWPMFDLAGFYVPDGAVAEVLSIRPAPIGSAIEYEVVTRFRAPGAADADSMGTLTLTVFSVLENGRWVLANALPRRTASWRRETIGPITYHIDPRQAFSPTRARAALAFVDSVSKAFGIPRLGPTDYYVAPSVDALMEALGVRTSVTYGSAGGFSKPVNRQVFSGIPASGENYRHELAHVVLLPLLDGGTMTVLASEGVATWLGGTEGADFRGAVRKLAQYLALHPSTTLDSIIDSGSIPQSIRYASGAVLCDMLARRGGAPLIAAFLRSGPSANRLRAEVARLLAQPWPAIVSEWRAVVERLAAA